MHAEGTTAVRINGRSMAMAQAEVIASLFVEGVANASVCGLCSSEAFFIAERVSRILLDAVAVAEIDVLESTNGESRELVVREFMEHIMSGSALAAGEVRAAGAPWLQDCAVCHVHACAQCVPWILYGPWLTTCLCCRAALSLLAACMWPRLHRTPALAYVMFITSRIEKDVIIKPHHRPQRRAPEDRGNGAWASLR